jgi:hypothetical protein
MRRTFTLSAIFLMALLVSCGGGEDGEAADRPSGAEGTSTSVASGGGGSAGDASAQNGEFCAPDSVDDIFDDLDFAAATSTNLEDQVGAVREALAAWSERAPSEIRDDVEVLVGTLGGFYELLEEYEFDFFTLAQESADDPRFAALGSARFEEAAASIERYCGFDIERPSVEPPQDSTDGGGIVMLDGELPEGFPEELVPPESEVESAGRVGPAVTGTFRSTATMEEIREFYEEKLGAPNVIDSQNLVWSVFKDGQVTSVTVSGGRGDIFIGVSVSGD